jgi:hypothetical protein
MIEKAVFLLQILTTFFMTGVIWIIQIVHYPLFRFVGAERYGEHQIAHQTQISYVVAPTMIVEAITAALITFYPPKNADAWLLWFGLILTAVIWASTFFLQVPLHERLSTGFDAETHRTLVATNWIRTAAWTLRSTLILWLLIRNL